MKARAAVPLLLFLSAFALAQDKESPRKDSGKRAAFDQFKQLAGEWAGKEIGHGDKEMEVRVKYKVTSNGSALVETLFPEGEHEMVTIIHPDGDSLMLTHYCALGNQPHMKADGKGGSKVAFKFTHATNLKSDKDMHMHDVTYTFVD